MIRYQLACDKGHDFESWFRDSASYDDQAERGLLSCPLCGSAEVGKAMMAPRIGKGASSNRSEPSPDTPAPDASAPSGVPAMPQPMTLVSPEERALRAKMRELRDHLTKTSDYVGPGFADQARRMHEGELEHRTIHGEATPDEVRGLLEDGVPVAPLPIVPDDRN